MTRRDWVVRCARRFQKAAAMTWSESLHCASVCADQQAEHNGASGDAWDEPEETADEEMSNWTDDEGGGT